MKGPVHDQLVDALISSSSFATIVDDYLACVAKLRELQVRNAQLDREAGELRLENDTLLHTVEEARRSSASPAELQEAKARAAQLQEELIEAYKEKSAASDGRAQALQQLEVVRDLNAQQSSALEQASAERHKLLDEVRSLRSEVSKLTDARDLAVKELQSRAAEIQAAERRANGLETENQDLVQRLMAMKEEEVNRMTETSRMCEDMLRHAKREAAEILVEARTRISRAVATAAATTATAAGGGGGASVTDAMMKRLNVAAEALGSGALPTHVASSCPALHPGGCYSLAIDATGNLMASCGADKVVRLWDIHRSTVSCVLRGAHEAVNDVAFTLDSKLVLGAEDRNAVRIWDARTGRLVPRALTGHAGKVTGVATSLTDPETAYTVSADRYIKVWRLGTGTCTGSFWCRSTARRLRVLSESGLVVAGHVNGHVSFWDPRSSKKDPVSEIAGGTGREICSVTPSLGGTTVVACSRDSSLIEIDTRKFVVKGRITATGFRVEHTPWPQPALNPSASHLIAGSEDGSLFLWNMNSFNSGTSGNGTDTKPMKVLKVPPMGRSIRMSSTTSEAAAVTVCAWSPQGHPVVSADRLGGVTFWASSSSNEQE